MTLKELLGNAYKENMTAEEIAEALANVELNNNDDALEKLKQAVSKANSEAADYKKQLKAKMTEEELKQAEREKELNDLKSELETLKKANFVNENKAEFISLGYDDRMATESAQALLNGDFKKVFQNQKAFLETYQKQVESNLLKGTSKPTVGTGTEKTISKEQFDNFSYSERMKLLSENPTLFAELNK